MGLHKFYTGPTILEFIFHEVPWPTARARVPREDAVRTKGLGTEATPRNHTILGISRETCKIGGPGHFVEIDESKFGKRKFHKGKRVVGCWVVGGIDRQTKDTFFLKLFPTDQLKLCFRF